ncbi:MAG: UDP-3-O-(3-hydroxymyristoyl)glucosamine N-acyltransferase [Flavobacteriales bacterium]|nr:UDP-3-O-(3-hydroxymyristoyl)glucosamine N-acyltransferase [Flavobacteriales bacterium]MCB9191560.1 UDP-3-O-(3-hydroxymyristoyl)glucosamine N-acyltransferase [Flavobacteriales bacterium]MCB9204375.1 UDP-3-O-(3-hydroxymyristoyl)glucosamine N-acyltransferase [Flavobacteriales bacterium]
MKFNNPITVGDLAKKVNGKVIGNSATLITGLNEIHRVEKGDVTFCDNSKYIKAAINSAASVILINEACEAPKGKSLIVVQKPFQTFSDLSKELRGDYHSTASVDPSAKVGSTTRLFPGVVIGKGVTIGEHCIIHPNVTIYDGCTIGNNVIIHSGTVIGADAFYYQRTPNGYNKLHSSGTVRIDDNVEIGAGCTIDRGVTSETMIGAGTKIDNMVQIGHDTVIGRNCLFASQVGIAGVVTVEDDVILWGQVGVQKDLTIGKGAVVLGQSGLAKSLEGGITYFGSPVREAREKMKELALIKQLPDIIRELRG